MVHRKQVNLPGEENQMQVASVRVKVYLRFIVVGPPDI